MKKQISFILTILLSQSTLFSNQIEKSIEVIQKGNNQLQSYQQQIDKNSEVKENLLQEYKYTNSTIKNTKTYNEQLKNILTSQKEEVASLDKQLIDIEKTQKEIYPLMEKMIKSLKTLVLSDIPFLLDERLDRVEKLEKSLNRADLQAYEKYRIILEALKIEYDYAKSIETYQDKIEGKTYNLFRLGRTALYAQSLDLNEYLYFNKESKSWKEISSTVSKSNIRKGIKIAKKQQNIAFLNLPFLAKKEMK